MSVLASARTSRPSKFSQQDAENLVREAAARYVTEQSKENKAALHDAIWKLGDFDPPQEEWVGWAPSHRFMLDLMPDRLKWPDPLWGDSMFD
jgi:hypothetical protein